MCAWSSAISGADSAAAARGSFDSAATGSFATSSDWTPIRAGALTGSTSNRIAAIDRWTNDTIRVERTRTACPAGEIHSASRRRTPSRRSSVRV